MSNREHGSAGHVMDRPGALCPAAGPSYRAAGPSALPPRLSSTQARRSLVPSSFDRIGVRSDRLDWIYAKGDFKPDRATGGLGKIHEELWGGREVSGCGARGVYG